RGNYWRGRAAEAAGDSDAMRAGYEAAARYPTAYYGQLVRAKLGMDVVALRQPPPPDPCYQPALVGKLLRAAEMLYAIGERDVVQVTPEAGRDTAKRFGVTYDWNKLVSDPGYNTQMGAAELSSLLREYRGSHIMTFAGYNAGRGRVQEWLKAYGDPRDPKVDA